MARNVSIFLFLFSVGLITVEAQKLCCEPGTLLQAMQSNFKCKNFFSEELSPIRLDCKETTLVKKTDNDFFINREGQLQFIIPNRFVAYEPESYCTAQLVSRTSSVGEVALLCDTKTKPVIHEDMVAYCMLVSAIFLIATAAFYMTGGRHRDLLGKSILNLCVTLALALYVIVYMKLVPYSDMGWCAVRGFSAYYFSMVSFFWMNVISLQSLVLTKHSDPVDMSKASELDRKMFGFCALYAWGVPLVFTIVMAIINYMPGDHLKPGIGLNHCWFFDTRTQWEYMYSIMSLLTAANLLIFVTITVHMCCSGKPYSDSFKHKFSTCVRLFIVTGIPWIFEMISSVAPDHLAWEIIDLFNSLQGLWIFLALVVCSTRHSSEQYVVNIMSSELPPPYSKLEK